MIRTGRDETRDPKYSHVERERRWLVDRRLVPPLPARYVLIEDRYLTGTRFRLRRMVESDSGTVALKLAKKYPSDDPTARPMVNAYINEEEFAVLARLAAVSITKRRYKVEGYSLDQFAGPLSGLMLAEREAHDADALAAIVGPTWAVREVTHDSRFEGGALAMVDAEAVSALLGS